MSVLVYALKNPDELYVVAGFDASIAYGAARRRAQLRGEVDGAAPVPECIARLEHDQGDGAVSRVRRRLEPFRLTGCRFRDCPASRRIVNELHTADLRARCMI